MFAILSIRAARRSAHYLHNSKAHCLGERDSLQDDISCYHGKQIISSPVSIRNLCENLRLSRTDPGFIHLLRRPFNRLYYCWRMVLSPSDDKNTDVNQFLEAVPGWTQENHGECFRCRSTATQLFHVSRAIWEDVRSNLYSQNLFMLFNGAYEGLAPLLNLTPVAIRSLRRLFIRLDPSMTDALDGSKPIDNVAMLIISGWK